MANTPILPTLRLGPRVGSTAEASPGSEIPTEIHAELEQVGPYRILELLGRGGMGMVYRAHDPQLGRDIALKMLLPALAADAEARFRFLREARAVASLAHDHIVTIHQVGEANGLPFLVMELLSGMSLAHWLESGAQATLPQILRIGRDIACGLAAAHARGLVHRDIKPANLWLEDLAVSPKARSSPIFRVKILDFGLARLSNAGAGLTQHGTIMGSASYIAPEQAAGAPVDGRADLFSLGCVLYRLCTGRLPFPGDGFLDSLVLLATTSPPPVRNLNPAVPPGLATLIMRLLAHNPEQRPVSAQEVADTLQEGITEGQAEEVPSGWKAAPLWQPRRQRPWRRRPWLGMVLIGLVTGILAGGITVLWGWLAVSPSKEPARPVAQPVAPSPEERRPIRLKFQGAYRAHFNEIRSLAYSPNGRCLATGSFDGSAVLWDVSTMQAMARLMGHRGVVEAVAFAPDSATLVTASSDGLLRLWNVPTGKPLGERLAHQGGANGLAFGRSGTGSWLLISGGSDHRIRLWQPDLTGEPTVLAGHKDRVDTVALSPDGTRIASGSCDRTVRIWDTRTCQALAELGGYADRVSHLVFAPDSKVLATADADEQSVRLWDVAGKREKQLRLPHKGNVHGVSWSPDGQLLAAVPQRDGGVVVWDLVTGRRVDVGPGQADYAWAVAFAPDGKSVAAGDYAILKVWNVER